MNIGDLFLRILADDKGFQADVVKKAGAAGDEAGKTLGQRLAAGVKKHGAQVIGTALAAGFAVATKGALELENAVASYQAATGASAEEAKAAGKVINRVAGEERASLESVTEAAIRVKRDLGATGEEAALLTKAFVRFARVTKQDAAEAVSDFDDILDAWGLTAGDAVALQDKLLVSNQKYGGSIVENQKALAAMAPQLRALNLDVDDGIGLLNLFASSGLDASAGQKALNAAITKLPKGESLTQFIARLSAVVDDGERARLAMEVFGTKGGAALANALRPGIDSLDDFTVSTEEVAGATEEAADVLDSTFSGRIQKAISVATAQLREFGAAFGPGLTGAAALASLLAPLGGGKLVKGILGPLVGLGGKVKALLVRAILGAVIPARIAGEAVGVATGQGMGTGIAGGKIKGLVSKSVGALGKVWGSILGKAFVAGAIAVIAVELLEELDRITKEIKRQSKEIGTNIGHQIATGTIEELEQSRAAVQQGLRDLGGDDPGFLAFLFADERRLLEEELAKIEKAIDERTQAAADKAVTNVETMRGSIADELAGVRRDASTTAGSASGSFGRIGSAATTMKDVIAANVAKIKAAVADLRSKLAAEAQAMIDGYYGPIIAAAELNVAKDKVAQDTKARNATKAGTAARHEADLTLAHSRKVLDEARLKLLETGKLTSKEQKIWLDDLERRYRDSTGDAREEIRKLIAKIKELAKVSAKNITINITGHAPGTGPLEKDRAAGGMQQAGEAGWVGERGRELFIPTHTGMVVEHRLSEALAAASRDRGGDTTNITVALPPTAHPDPFEVATQLRRLADFGVLRP